jgi:hypothetical protein
VFFIDETLFPLCRSIISQCNINSCSNNPHAVKCDLEVRVCCAVSAPKIIGSVFCKEMNSGHFVQRINRRKEHVGQATFLARTGGKFQREFVNRLS